MNRTHSSEGKEEREEQPCIFCRIIAKEVPAHIIDEDDQVIVFLSLDGSPMVVTKQHIPNIYDMPTDIGAAVMEKAIKVAKALKTSLECEGVYLTQANEHAAGQDVFHYHLHLYPCWGDKMIRAIREFVRIKREPRDVTEEMKAAISEKVRRGLADS